MPIRPGLRRTIRRTREKEHTLATRSRLWLALGIVAVLAAAAVGFVAVALPRLVNTPEFRSALAARAGEALGSPVEWKSLAIGLFPPRVTLEEPVLVGQAESPDASASVRAQAIDLRLSLLPLLERRIAVDSLVLHGVVLVASRTTEGIVLPAIGRRGGQVEGQQAEPAPDPGEDAFALDLRELRIEDGRVLVHDRTLTPPVDWRLESLSATARGRSLGEPLEIEASGRLLANERALGSVASEGRVDLAGSYALDFDLDAVPVAELRGFLPDDPRLGAGTLSGRVSVAGKGSALSNVTADVAIAALALETRGLALSGDLALRAQRPSPEKLAFEGTWSTPDAGRVEASGERTSDGGVRVTAMLDSFELAPLAPLAGPGRTLAGRATGEVSLAMEAGELADVETDLSIESARYADGRIDAKGKLELALGLEGLAKDDAARVQAVFVPESGGRLDVNGTGTVAGAVRASLRFDAFDLSLIAPLLPEKTELAGKLTGDVEVESNAERELARLASHLRVGGARVVRAPVDVAGDLSLDARIEGEGPIVLSARAALADGGRVQVSGTSTRKGVLDLKTELTSFDLAALTPFLGSSELSLAGRASGPGRLTGAYDALASLALELRVVDAAIRMGANRIDGPFDVRLELSRPFAADRRGTVGLDLVLAEVAVGETFKKPAGVRALLTTKFESDAAGRLVFETRGQLNNITELLARGALGEQATTVSLTTSSFDLKGWSGLVPALASNDPSGALAFEALSLDRSEGAKDRFSGRIALRSVELALTKSSRVRLRGNLVGAGPRLELNTLTATLHGLTLGLEGRVEDPLASARFEVAAHSIGEAEANELVSGLTSMRDTLFGALRFDAKLAGEAGGEASLYDSLDGNVRFTIGESGGGRLRGVSLLRTTLDAIPVLGGAARLAEKLRADPTRPEYLGEKFEVLEGDLAIAAGELDARTLRIRSRGHEARLNGRVKLEGLALDMRGELLLDPALVAFLSGRPAAELAGREPVRIPLARVTNTLSNPKVSLAPETLAAVPKLLFLTTGVGAVVDQAVGGVVGKVGEKVGETVGSAVGKVGDTVGGVLGKAGEAIGQTGSGGGMKPVSPPAPSRPAPVPSGDEAKVAPSEAVPPAPADPAEPAPGIGAEGAGSASAPDELPQRSEATEPTEPLETTEPVEPTEPLEPLEPTEPTEPTDSTEPVEPAAGIEPLEPAVSTELPGPSEPADATELPPSAEGGSP